MSCQDIRLIFYRVFIIITGLVFLGAFVISYFNNETEYAFLIISMLLFMSDDFIDIKESIKELRK